MPTPRGIRDRSKADTAGGGKTGGTDVVCLGIAALGWAIGLVATLKARRASSEAQRLATEAQDAKVFTTVYIR